MTEDETLHASLRASVSDIRTMIQQTSLHGGETAHSNLYIRVYEDRVMLLAAAPGEVVLSYGTFTGDYFDDLTLEKEDYAEAILGVEDFLDFLDVASDSGTTELKFSGDGDRDLATWLEFDGALTVRAKLPGSKADFDRVPFFLEDRFTDDEVYTDSSGEKELPTRIRTNTDSVLRIINAVEKTASGEDQVYPITVEDEQFKLDVGTESGASASGTLPANEVEGPDVENYYYQGFETIFEGLGGSVELQTAPGNAPLCVVQEGTGNTIRHVNGSANVA